MPAALLLKGGRVIDPAADLDKITDVLIEDGVVKAVEAGAHVDLVLGIVRRTQSSAQNPTGLRVDCRGGDDGRR